MEDQLADYSDDLSIYLEYANVTPLPVDSFSFDDSGITFYYPYQQFALLSEYSGAVQFQYGELQSFLIQQSGSIPSLLDVVMPQYSDAQIKEEIEAIAEQGTLPAVPAKLNDSLTDLIEAYRLVRTPDQYPGGRYFQLETPQFRQVLLMSDALTSGWEASVVEGILSTRMNLYGIQTGVTTAGTLSPNSRGAVGVRRSGLLHGFGLRPARRHNGLLHGFRQATDALHRYKRLCSTRFGCRSKTEEVWRSEDGHAQKTTAPIQSCFVIYLASL